MKISSLHNQSFKALCFENMEAITEFPDNDGVQALTALRQAMPELKRIAKDCDVYIQATTFTERGGCLNMSIFSNKPKSSQDRIAMTREEYADEYIFKPFTAKAIIKKAQDYSRPFTNIRYNPNENLDSTIRTLNGKPVSEINTGLARAFEQLRQAFNTTYRETSR